MYNRLVKDLRQLARETGIQMRFFYFIRDLGIRSAHNMAVQMFMKHADYLTAESLQDDIDACTRQTE